MIVTSSTASSLIPVSLRSPVPKPEKVCRTTLAVASPP